MKTTKIHLLAIETSGLTCAAGLSVNGRPVAEISASIKNIHSRVLVKFVQELLDTAALASAALDGIIVSAGPGSFTGLRIGYSVVKGLAHALQKPVLEVPTLDIWAYQQGEQQKPVLSVIDAHRGEIFVAEYRWQSGEMHQYGEYERLEPAALSGRFNQPVLITGADARKFPEQLLKVLPTGTILAQPAPESPQIWALSALGFRKYADNDFADLPGCEPLYLRTFKGAS